MKELYKILHSPYKKIGVVPTGQQNSLWKEMRQLIGIELCRSKASNSILSFAEASSSNQTLEQYQMYERI